MEITEDIKYIGVNDHKIDMFEGQYKVKNGMAYNSYVILDEKVAILDTVDRNFTEEWLSNLKNILNGRKPDYLVVHHMEPDHAASILDFMKEYPDTVIATNAKAFSMIDNLFDINLEGHKLIIQNGDTLNLGKHSLTFVFAPMVHWPEVMVSYDACDKVLFSADAFGKFGALDIEEDWEEEARRYYFGIAGKFGMNVQMLLKKAASLDIKKICSLHGPLLSENLSYYLSLYDKWSSYQNEEGIVIAYTSVYGHTKQAVDELESLLKKNYNYPVKAYDLARDDMSSALSDAFKYGKLVLATTTYNNALFPFMNDYLSRLIEHNLQNKKIGIIENGSWAPMVSKLIRDNLSKCKNVSFFENEVKILSSIKEKNHSEIEALAKELEK